MPLAHGGRNQRPQFPPPEDSPTSFPLFCCSVPGKSGEVALRCLLHFDRSGPESFSQATAPRDWVADLRQVRRTGFPPPVNLANLPL